MEKLGTYAPLIARIFIAAMFIPAGLAKMGDIEGFTGYLTSGGLPAALAWPSVLFEIALGLAMLVGFQTRIAALAGAAFCIVAAVLYHMNFADQIQAAMFFKNFAIAGGFLMFFAHGAGALSFDGRKA
jgi:putative oxidoreductase